jgi:hypothetical protein
MEFIFYQLNLYIKFILKFLILFIYIIQVTILKDFISCYYFMRDYVLNKELILLFRKYLFHFNQ